MKRFPPDLHAVTQFLEVARLGSFTKAARTLGQGKSVLSRKVTLLEDRIGAALLVRSARGAELTDAGHCYYEEMSRIMGEIELVQERAAKAASSIAGVIRITAPLSFGVARLAPLLAEFSVLHPNVELDVSFDDRAVNLVIQGFDLAIRIGNLADSAFIARKIGSIELVLVGSPGYIERHGKPEHPSELNDHAMLAYTNAGQQERWHFILGKEHVKLTVNGILRADNGDMLCAAAVAGRGLVLLPSFIAKRSLEDGSLVTMLPDYEIPPLGIHAVTLPHRSKLARVEALGDHIKNGLAATS